jgi:hypothetical protein
MKGIMACQVLCVYMMTHFMYIHHVLTTSFVLEGRAGAAAVLELGSEPLYILAQHLLLLRLRVVVEGLATLARCVLTYVLLVQGIGLVGI